MINIYPKNSIGYKIMTHDNNYGEIKLLTNSKLPSLSVVIPYYEAWNTINRTLEYLLSACKKLEYEIILVDDGSIKYPAETTIRVEIKKQIKIVSLNKNVGRSLARNRGLKESKNEVVAFMDADMVMPRNLIVKHLKLHCHFGGEKGCITFSLFNNLSISEWEMTTDKETLFKKTNDFRSECNYLQSWIGCESDNEYISHKYKILKDTNNLREWPIGKTFGPWLLPNMVLGGFFTVNRDKAIKVGGFSESFQKYGFTETPVSTKIIAKFDDYVIPVSFPYVLHLHDGGVALSQGERNIYFKKAHHLFFDIYLNQDLEETIKNEKI